MDKEYNHILAELRELKAVVTDLGHKIDEVDTDIRAKIKLEHQAINFNYKDHEKRLSFAEKMLFSTAGLILMGVLGAFITSILK